MADLKSKRLIYLKGFLFLVILVFALGLIMFETRSWQIAVLLLLVVWASARLYYFMFYVIEKICRLRLPLRRHCFLSAIPVFERKQKVNRGKRGCCVERFGSLGVRADRR